MRPEHGGVARQDALRLGRETGIAEHLCPVDVAGRDGDRGHVHQLAPRRLHVTERTHQIAAEQIDVAEVMAHLSLLDGQPRVGVAVARQFGIGCRFVEPQVLHPHETAGHMHSQCHERRVLNRRDRAGQPGLGLSEAPGHLCNCTELSVQHRPRLAGDAPERERFVANLLRRRRLAGASHHIGERAHRARAKIVIARAVDRPAELTPCFGVTPVVDEIDSAPVQVPRRTRHRPIMANPAGQRGKTSGSALFTASSPARSASTLGFGSRPSSPFMSGPASSPASRPASSGAAKDVPLHNAKPAL